MFVGALTILAADAQASSVAGCRYEGEVKWVVDADEITLGLAVATAEAFGHSGPPAVCAEPGTEISFTPDDDAEVRAAGVTAGDRIRVEDTEVWSGRKHFTERDFVEKLPAPPAVPTIDDPQVEVPPAQTPAVGEPTPPSP